MKRFGFAIFLLSIFCLTGCGTKTLNCSMVNDANAELKINQDVIVDFKKDQMVKFDMKTSVDLSDNYASYADELEKNLKKEYERMSKTCQGFISTITVYANFMDSLFSTEESRKEYAEIYLEYKEYSESIKSVLIDNGWVKEKKK